MRELLERDEDVVFAYLHGSLVEGEAVRDVDVAVWLRENVDPLEYILERGLEIEEHLGLSVDIQPLNKAPVTFRYHVYTCGTPLVVKDKLLHDTEIARTILVYSDLLILRKYASPKQYRAYSNSHIKSV